ncbi:uncharacterized protein LOC121375047 isoform X2 [Gigantopelta aegis]|uniref:uncharacterized protein LOC121375047 isoform X2 n=1 Tax=Gigantopelta aegis TaxID=1735272 RepID=UPI001B8894F4|nr:uncharacterized protein LOC121375047 isoform X2 [Gigantopelta aegis]
MASRVTFVSGTAEVKRREHHDNGFEQNLELSVQPKVVMVDGKCTCCPYGYHIDLDFLRYCEAMSSGGTLKQLKRIQRSKRKLRKSMEIMLQQQGQLTEDGGTPPPDVVHSTEASRLMNMVEYEQSSTHKILDDIDSNVDATIASIDYMMTSAKKSRNISSDSDDSPLSPNIPRYSTFPLNQTPNGDESSHLATSLSTSGRSDSMSSLSSVSTVSSENPQGTLMSHGQIGRQTVTTTATAEVFGSTTKYHTVTSAQIAATLATHMPQQTEGNTSPHGSTTNISKTSLHAIREAMAMSLQRMRELEEQVKAIPILQVRISVLKEEKRLLMLQHRAKSSALKPNTRSIGTGQDLVLPPFSDKMTAMEKMSFTTMTLPTPRTFEFPSNISPRSTSTPRVPDLKSPPPTMPKPKVRNAGVGDHSVIEPYLLQAHLPTGFTITENEVHNEIRSSTFERETLILNRSRLQSQSDRIEEQLPVQPQTHITINQIQRGGPKALTRSIGIGDGNVFDTGLQIHEKELRTVIIGQSGQVGKRNVGIECRPATRDVGIHFCCDDEKPSTRTVGVNVNTSSLITSLNFKGEELRIALQDVLHKNVRSTGTNCNFRPLMNDASTMYQKVQYVTVGVGEECRTDVDIRPHMAKKSVGINVRPEMNNRSMNTEKGWLLDQSTNTPVSEKRAKATMTEKPRQLSSSTFMEKTLIRNTSSQTDVRTFLATDQLKNVGCNTVKKYMQSTGVNTDVKRLVNENFDFAVTFKDGSSNTMFSVADKSVNTDKNRYSDQKTVKTKTVGVSNDRTDSFVCSFDGIDRSSQTKELSGQDQFSSETVTVETVQKIVSDVTAQNRLSSDAYMGVDMSQFMSGKAVTSGLKARKSGARNSGEFKRDSGEFKRNSGELKRSNSGGEEYQFIEETFVIRGDVDNIQSGDIQVEKIKSSQQVVIGSSGSKTSKLPVLSGGSLEEKKTFQQRETDAKRTEDLSQTGMRRSSGEGSSTEFGSFQTKVVEERVMMKTDGDGYSQSQRSVYSSGDGDQQTFLSGKYSTISNLDRLSSIQTEGSSVDSSMHSMTSSGGSGGYGSSYSSTLGNSGVGQITDVDRSRYSTTTNSGGNIYWYPVDSLNGEITGPAITQVHSRHFEGVTDSGTSTNQSSGEGSGLRSEGGVRTRLEEESIIRRGVNSLQTISDSSAFSHSSSLQDQSDMSGSSAVKSIEVSEKVVSSEGIGNLQRSEGFLVISSHGSDSLFKELENQVLIGASRTVVGSEHPAVEGTVREEKSVTKTTDGHTVTTVIKRTVRNGETEETKTISESDIGSSALVTESPSIGLDMSIDSVDIGKLDRASLLKSELSQLAGEMREKKMSKKHQGDYSESHVTSSSYDDDDAGFEGDDLEFSASRKEYFSSIDGGSLKSCMKRSKSDELSMKKGISFAATVVGGTNSSSSEATSTSESDGETDSYEEGSYDGRHGNIVYQCKDDEAIAQGIPGAKMFDQNIRETYELNSEIQTACEVLAQYLIDSTTIQTKELNASVNVIQQEWFRITNNKLVDPHQVEDYISSFNEISKKLMEHIVNMADANGNTALHYSVSNCNFEVVGLLLDTGICDLNKQNKGGYTAIMLAALASIQTNSQEEVVCRLFAEGDVNIRAVQTGQTAMMLAVSHGRPNMVKLLLENGATINEQDDDGSTALMCACEHGHSDIVKLLLAHPSCDATLTDNDGSTALTIAMEASHRDIGVILYAHLNFAKGPTSPGIARKRRTSSSPTPSI